MSWDSSDEEFINAQVDEVMRKQDAAKGINQEKDCDGCHAKVVHRTCGVCNEVKCKKCTQHWQCPGCDKWFCEQGCCTNGSGGLYYCGAGEGEGGCGVICEECLPWLYEDFTLMDSCCDGCKQRIPPFYANIKKKSKGKGKEEE